MSGISKARLALLLQRLVDRTMDLSFTHSDEPGGIRWRRWDWSIGVAFYGVWKACETLRNETCIPLIKRWIDERIDGKIEKVCVNSNSLMLSVMKLAERYPNAAYADRLRTFDDYLMIDGPRTPSGALEHTVLDNNWAHQVWADTVFMSLLYLAQRGATLNREDYMREALRQLIIHFELLWDSSEDLFVHGWHDLDKKPLGVHWGRGNAWMTAGTVEMLEAAPEDFEGKSEILHMLDRQLERLASLQDESGLWRTVLNSPDTYLESSVTAGVAYGTLKGIRLGFIDGRYREMGERAIRAVAGKIDAEGNVTGGSSGTPVKEDALEYNRIPCEVTPFTQGLALLALTEALQGSTQLSEAEFFRKLPSSTS